MGETSLAKLAAYFSASGFYRARNPEMEDEERGWWALDWSKNVEFVMPFKKLVKAFQIFSIMKNPKYKDHESWKKFQESLALKELKETQKEVKQFKTTKKQLKSLCQTKK